jgi:hypothetical protein
MAAADGLALYLDALHEGKLRTDPYPCRVVRWFLKWAGKGGCAERGGVLRTKGLSGRRRMQLGQQPWLYVN